MSAPASIIADLQAAITTTPQDKRIETLRRVTDLFFEHSDRLCDAQVDLFDDVLGHLIDRIERRALAELSGRTAPVANAPVNVVRNLARDDDIAIAAPVLEKRPGRQMGSEHDLDRAAAEYDGLAAKTAQRVLRFWQVRRLRPSTDG